MVKKAPDYQLKIIPIKKIKVSKLHWHREHSEEDIDKLAEQIASVGLLEPIIVRDVDGRLELLAGEKRLRAVIKLKLSEIRAVIVNVNDTDGELVSIYENLGQSEMTQHDMDRAIARAVELETLKQGKDEPDAQVIDTVAIQSEQSPREVRKAVKRVSKLIPEVKTALAEKKITKSQADELESLDPATQRAMLKNILKDGLTTHQVRDKKAEKKATKAAPKDDKSPAHERMAQRYFKVCLTTGERFKESLVLLNDHVHDTKVSLKKLTDVKRTSALKGIQGQLDELLQNLKR